MKTFIISDLFYSDQNEPRESVNSRRISLMRVWYWRNNIVLLLYLGLLAAKSVKMQGGTGETLIAK